jgi:hypothetical protein
MSNVLQKALGFDTTPIQAFSRPETIFFWWARSPSVVYWAAIERISSSTASLAP